LESTFLFCIVNLFSTAAQTCHICIELCGFRAPFAQLVFKLLMYLVCLSSFHRQQKTLIVLIELFAVAVASSSTPSNALFLTSFMIKHWLKK